MAESAFFTSENIEYTFYANLLIEDYSETLNAAADLLQGEDAAYIGTGRFQTLQDFFHSKDCLAPWIFEWQSDDQDQIEALAKETTSVQLPYRCNGQSFSLAPIPLSSTRSFNTKLYN